MNLSEFSQEVNTAKLEFSEALDKIFRTAMEALDGAHAEVQSRINIAKGKLYGEPTEDRVEYAASPGDSAKSRY